MRSLKKMGPLIWTLLGVAAATPAVRVSLRTSWPETPLLLEAIETISAEEPGVFFHLLDALVNSESLPALDTLSPEAIHQVTFQTAVSLGFLREPGALASAELGIALHAAAPKVQAFYQFYAEQRISPELHECGSWVDWYGEQVCDVETLMRLAGHDTIDANGRDVSNMTFARPKLLSFDHIHPDPAHVLEFPPRTAVLYASPSSANFRELHSYLLKLSSSPQPRVEYVLRHIPHTGQSERRKSYLSGYGVALDLKKTDYLAVDDRQSASSGHERNEASSEGLPNEDDLVLSLIEQYPQNTSADISPSLSEEELLNIGIQATQLITNSSNPLATLAQLSQNFPKYAVSLARRVVVNENVHNEVLDNQMRAQGGASAMWLNGLAVQDSDQTPLGLIRLLRKERGTMRALTELGLDAGQAVDLLTHRSIALAQGETSDVLDALFDASDRPEGGGVVVWWNDLTKDSRYARWNPSITGLLRQTYPGQFHNVKQNLINVIVVSDLSQTASLNFIAGPVSNIISRGFPIRFGVVPGVETDDARKMARLFYHLLDTYGRAKTMAFLAQVGQIQMPVHLLAPTVDWDLVRHQFKELQQTASDEQGAKKPKFSIDDIFDGNEDGERGLALTERIEKAHAYAQRLDATPGSCPTGHAFVNAKHFDLDDEFLKHLQTEMSTQIQYFQEKIYLAELGDADLGTIDTYFYDLPETHLRRNRYIFPSAARPGVGSGSLRVFNLPEIFKKTVFAPAAGAYLYPDSEEMTLTTFVVADLDSEGGIALMKEALLSLEGSASRLSFIHNPASKDSESSITHRRISPIVSHLVTHELLSKVSLKEFGILLNPESAFSDDAPASVGQTVLSENSVVYQLLQDVGVTMDGLSESETHDRYSVTSRLVARELGIEPGELALLVNGRVVGPIEPHAFSSADFTALEEYELRKRTAPVIEALTNLTITSTSLEKIAYGNLVSMASSVISSVQLPDPSEQGLLNTTPLPRKRNYRQLSGNFTSFSFGDPSTAVYHIGVVVDPVSVSAQKWSAFLEWLSTVPSVFSEVYLNPGRYSELPLKRFYRFNLSPSLSFDENGLEIEAQTVFDGLPTEPLYTMAMDVPPSWLVRPREALYDLDNIQLSTLSPEDRERGLEAIFELDYLVIEGHARDVLTNAPPRGLQLQLAALDGTVVDDTQVVLNMGYLQFKATPGVFQLDIREGRGRDVYALESAGNEGWNSPNVSVVGNEITLTSFEGLTLYPRVRRRPGMEKADVLDEFVVGEEGSKNLFDNLASRVVSLFRPKNPPIKTIASRQADINIFTVASGLLYERFASIMILSVLKNTKSTVKFWFIENFLSPSFLEFLPHFAEEYNFDYELVTYKWPSWLRAQTEKQRIIWAYKILFLDVLFPMDLKKVIFVDADQIVRTDLQELVDLDMHGAPYGYTPMGDDNTDMEGFRFWKTGYWKDFLRGRPYHISALYVVDLARFRQDILRGSYQQLSQDPNSLANLDQDLPNNLQREVPIFSLDEDWLWVCSKDRLHRAKTIDLCQNPLTKEPKLARARQIPEWEAYDAEIARLARALADAGRIRSHVAAADANALAGAAAAAATGPASGENAKEGGGAGLGAGANAAADVRAEGADGHAKDEL
ncbi:UDP-glucose:glycoprotein glucosyltransferase-domain-containing protein [Phellopilus nigrolimitatus]|nr:UDP-glucose:glycoprotein glucosyltransferase-domain-containing protein [Phellopilus nigrolimitatus]